LNQAIFAPSGDAQTLPTTDIRSFTPHLFPSWEILSKLGNQGAIFKYIISR
jgi:hypothetical protein